MYIALKNLGTVNKNMVVIGPITIWFSYETPVAFRNEESENGGMIVCRENEWGPTTEKLLKTLQPDKKARISGEEFEKRISNM